MLEQLTHTVSVEDVTAFQGDAWLLTELCCVADRAKLILVHWDPWYLTVTGLGRLAISLKARKAVCSTHDSIAGMTALKSLVAGVDGVLDLLKKVGYPIEASF